MKTTKKINNADVITWVSESGLDLPDRWDIIQQNLKRQIPENIEKTEKLESRQETQLFKRKRLLIAGISLVIVVLLICVIVFGLWGRWFSQTKNANDHYQAMTLGSSASDSSGETSVNQTWGTVPNDPALLAFQNRVDEQVRLMDQENIPDQYTYYAGSFIEDQKTFVVTVTCSPEDFIKTYADILDFSFIQVRQVKYTYKELEVANEALNKEWLKSERLINMGVIGYGVDEMNNAVMIEVVELNDQIRSEVAKLIPDTDMIEFEVGAEYVPY
jgi:hypothetical protein